MLLLAACGGDDGSSAGTTEPAEGTTEFKIGLVTDVGQLNDRGFNQLAHEGLKRAEKDLGVEIRVAQSRTAADYVPNHTTLARQGFDLIIGVGFAQGEAVAAAAKSFPESRYAIIDVDQTTLPGKPANVLGVLFREEQAGYLAGVLAGLAVKKDPRRRQLGRRVQGAAGRSLHRRLPGRRQVLEAGRSNHQRLLVGLGRPGEVQGDRPRTRSSAGRASSSRLRAAAGLGALDAAGDRNAWGIGVDADQSFLGNFVLTSAMKRVDEAVFRIIRSVTDGTWQGGLNVTFGLAEHGVGLGKINPDVPQEHRSMLEDVQRKILAGEIEIPKSL